MKTVDQLIGEQAKRAKHYSGVTQLKIGDIWRASEASETVLGVDNVQSGG